MFIYVSDSFNNSTLVQQAIDLNCGHMVSPKYFRNRQKVRWALDNGAYRAFATSTPFDSELFYSVLDKVNNGNMCDFVAVPDIVCGGKESLMFSLRECDNIHITKYLVVQDGMDTEMIRPHVKRFDGIFVGGSVIWKYKTAKKWCVFAHKNNIKCHIGKIGTLKGYIFAHSCGVDSVDGSNPTRNNRMYIIQQYYNALKEQERLF